MKAVILTDYGGVDKLALTEVPEPFPGPREVKVRVEAAGINPIDYKVRRGDLRATMPLDLPTILGRDVAGTVVEVGSEVREFSVGDRVMGLVEHGYAEWVVAPASAFARVPDPVGTVQAAALPLAGLTGVQLVEDVVHVTEGEVVLVTGALGVSNGFFYSRFALLLFFSILIPLSLAVHHGFERPAQRIVRGRLSPNGAGSSKPIPGGPSENSG